MYKFSQHTKGRLSRQSLYTLTNEITLPIGIRFETIGVILQCLKEVTGKSFGIADILQYQTDDEFEAEEREREKRENASATLEEIIEEHGEEWVLEKLQRED